MAPIDVTAAIHAEALSFSYAAKEGEAARKVFGPLDFDIAEGSFTLMVGPTGCGKTTLLRNLKPELAPNGERSGKVFLFGSAMEELDAAASAQAIGYVSQNPDNQIVCDTVWHELAFGLENLGVSVDEMRRRIAEVAHFFGIEPWIEHATDALSGGQKQLLTLASILALRPRILLLDEPTNQLDPVASRNFLHALFRVNRELGLTIVVVTHEPEVVAEYATDFLEMKDGQLARRDIEDYRKEVHARAANVDYDDPKIAAPQLAEGTGVAVEIKDLYVRYKRDLPFVLRGLDLQLRKGSVHALVGGNGSGKSTLLSVLGGVLKVERGHIKNSLAKNQALLPQNPKTLFVCDTVAEELAEWQKSCGYSDEDIAAQAKRFCIGHLMEQHPYDLSGGQQQLLACCKILLAKPDFIMMDEPTKGLDNHFRYIMADLMHQLASEGVTILLVTHDLAFAARVADTTSMLFDGQIACTQPTATFFKENLFYRPVLDWFFGTWELQGE